MSAVDFYTLGCKLNYAETEEIAAAFRARGYKPMDKRGGAPIAVVNTCTVTSKADQKARRLIRGLLAAPHAPLILVTGCYARLNRAAIEALDSRPAETRRLFVVDGERLRQGELPPRLIPEERVCLEIPAAVPALRSRAFIKIEDGCDNACSYCRVRLARGRARSEDAGAILRRLRELEAAGCAEAVLTGVNISQYNFNGLDLATLLAALLDGTASIALRLASLEPAAFSAALYDVLRNPRIRPHFHLSVQSASAAVLGLMGRSYTAAELNAILRRLREVKDDPFIACDIIAGFPREGAAEFEETFAWCAAADCAWIHAFPFSPRPGTLAAAMRPRVPEREAGKRVERLGELARAGHERYLRRWQGREIAAVAESACLSGARFSATTENYLKITLAAGSGGPPPAGSAFRCVIPALLPVHARDALADAAGNFVRNSTAQRGDIRGVEGGRRGTKERYRVIKTDGGARA